MPLREIGALLLLLVAVFALGNLWLYMVEGVLRRIARLFARRKEPPAWHPLPEERKEDSSI